MSTLMAALMTTFTPSSRVGQIVADKPAASRTFHRYGIDFCCGGGQELGTMCSKKGINVDEVLSTLASDLAGQPTGTRWKDASSPALIGHILTAFHEPLREELPRLHGMLSKVHRVHGHVDQERFDRLLTLFSSLKEDLEAHMLEEEEVLFPAMMQRNTSLSTEELASFENEHEAAGDALREIRTLTDNFVAPDYACNTWKALWDGLKEFESMMHEHVHLENNVLFARFGHF